MKIYKVSPIVKYSPFFELTYVSRFEFAKGDVVQIDFNRKKIYGVVLEKYDLKDAKVEIRKADFQTKKIESKDILKDNNGSGKNGVFSAQQFKSLFQFSQDWGIPLGEVIFYLFGEDVDTTVNVFTKMFKFEDGEIIIPDFSFEKYRLLNAPHISRLHLFFLWLEFFHSSPGQGTKIIIESDFLGVAEKIFLNDCKKIKIEIVEKKSIVKKYLVNLKEGEIINDETIEKVKNGKTFVFVLSNGYADRIYCNDCKKSYDCENCGHAYSLINEENERYLFCKNCKSKKVLKEDQYVICKNCGSWRIFPFGTGVQKVKELFPDFNIGGIKELNKFLIKKEIFDNVIVASLGPLVKGKYFDSDEKLIYLLSKLENISKNIYINKRSGDEISLQNFKDKEKFIKEEIILREKLNLPPFVKVVSLISNYKNKKFVDKFLLTDIEKFKTSGEIKKGNKYIYYWFVKKDIYEFARNMRGFGEVIVANTIIESSFSKG